MHVVCKDLLCVACIGLLPVEFFTTNTGLGKPIYVEIYVFWKARDLNPFLGRTHKSIFFPEKRPLDVWGRGFCPLTFLQPL